MKIKRILFMLVFALCLSFPVFTGCDYKTKLSAPKITLFGEDHCIALQTISGTDTYDIYCNSELYDTYKNTDNKKTILYDFSSALTENGKYEFYVVAVSNSLYLEDSNSSNIVEYNYVKVAANTPPSVEKEELLIDFNVSKDGVVSYTPINADVEYVLYLYSNSTGLKSYTPSTNVINLKNAEYSLKNEIYAVRLGYRVDDDEFISSDIKYYNTDNCGEYTDNIYIFDGFINDYYITSLNELKNIMYYTYINRIEDFNIKISDSMKKEVYTAYPDVYMENSMNQAVMKAMNSYYETQAYNPNNINGGYVKQGSDSTLFNIKVSYYGVKECDVTIEASQNYVYDQANNSGYYDVVDYEMLGSDYNNFVSDKYFLYTTCSTSEQLYWAIENKITPVVVKGSRADIIYNKAKEVLREIISEEMTDYEKALAIFDWISINTNYDYTNYDSMYRGGISLGNLPMYLPCFYLEGVFITGYSVCDGFSKAYSMMCNMLGIDCIRIVGTAITNGQEGGHAWNKVFIDKDGEGGEDGQYYLVDITWTEILSAGEEVSSHMYFLLGDNDVKATHKNFSNRKKFSNYPAPNSYYYYITDQFSYYNRETSTTTTYDWVIKNNTELKDLFYYTLDNAISSVEFVADIDYMIASYEYENGVGSYRSSNDVDVSYDIYGRIKNKYAYSTDTLYEYTYDTMGRQYVNEVKYYLLRVHFIECMRSLKFNEQYFIVTSYDGNIVFDENGNDGVLYILQQNLCIDGENNFGVEDETAHLFEYLANSSITGEFILYVKNTMLKGVSGKTYLSKLQNLIATSIANTDLILDISYIGVDPSDDQMQMFKMKIINN